MNLLSTAIYEVKEGELLILWGGRRIVARYLFPPMKDDPENELEHAWKRRYRWDSGFLILTRIYDNYKKRQDYIAITLGRNPAIIKDLYGRLIFAYRVPVISYQDEMGILSEYYVVPVNLITAGMNMWEVYNSYDFSKFSTRLPAETDWTEQVGFSLNYQLIQIQENYGSVGEYLALLQDYEKTLGIGDYTMSDQQDMNTDITLHKLTGTIYVRGRGGNMIDVQHPTRWKWNEKEGLGHSYTSAIMDYAGRQVRYGDGTLDFSNDDKWDAYKTFESFPYGSSGCVRQDRFGNIVVAGYLFNDYAIPFGISGITSKPDKDNNEKYETIFDEYNKKDEVLKKVYDSIPSETYFSWEEPPDAETERRAKEMMAKYYYALPTVNQQRVGFCISQNTNLIYLSWMHGNCMFIQEGNGYIAVGLRIAVSTDNGKHFEPLCPERVNYFTRN